MAGSIRGERCAKARALLASTTAAAMIMLSGPPTAATAARTDQVLSVYVAACPVDYVGNDYLEACYPTPTTDFLVEVRSDDAASIDPPVPTDQDGVATFDISGFAPGTVRIVTNGPQGGTAPYRIPAADCTAGGAPLEVEFPETRAAGPVIDIEVLSQEDVRCVLYFVQLGGGAPGSGGDRDNDAPEDEGVSDTTRLPDTGVGSEPSGGAITWLLGAGLLLLSASCSRRGRASER